MVSIVATPKEIAFAKENFSANSDSLRKRYLEALAPLSKKYGAPIVFLAIKFSAVAPLWRAALQKEGTFLDPQITKDSFVPKSEYLEKLSKLYSGDVSVYPLKAYLNPFTQQFGDILDANWDVSSTGKKFSGESPPLVMIDLGHGIGPTGPDPGAVYDFAAGKKLKKITTQDLPKGLDPYVQKTLLSTGKITERDIVIGIGEKLREKILAEGKMSVIMSYQTIDSLSYPYPGTPEKISPYYSWLANERFSTIRRWTKQKNKGKKPDFFISIHVNSAGSEKPYGSIVLNNETGTSLGPKNSKSADIMLAEYAKAMVWNGQRLDMTSYMYDDTPNRTGLAVLNGAAASEIVAVLFELGFIGNERDREHLIKKDFQYLAATALQNGIYRVLVEAAGIPLIG